MNRIRILIDRIRPRRKSATTIVVKIEKGVDELLSFSRAQIDLAAKAEAKASELNRTALSHRNEADKASRVASRFIDILS